MIAGSSIKVRGCCYFAVLLLLPHPVKPGQPAVAASDAIITRYVKILLSYVAYSRSQSLCARQPQQDNVSCFSVVLLDVVYVGTRVTLPVFSTLLNEMECTQIGRDPSHCVDDTSYRRRVGGRGMHEQERR